MHSGWICKDSPSLSRKLLVNLDGPADPDAAFAWATEIKRRDAELESDSAELESDSAELESDSAELESWDDTKRGIERDVIGR